MYTPSRGGPPMRRGNKGMRASVVLLGLVFLSGAAAEIGTGGEPSPLAKIRVVPGGRTFEAPSGKPFVPMGVNYYRPGTGWAPQLWKQFDAEATRADFARMKAVGVNCVRVFLTYG